MKFAGGLLLPWELSGMGADLFLSGLDYCLGTRLSRAPLALTWAVVEHCPLRCRHCAMQPQTTPVGDPRFLGRRIAESSVRWVSLIGGEPLLCREILPVLQILKEGGKFVSLGTSGAGLRHIYPELQEAGLDLLVLSIDALKPEEHDRFRGRRGLFREIEEVVFRQMANRTSRKPKLAIRISLHRENYQDVVPMVSFWKRYADRVIVQPVVHNEIHPIRDPEILFTSRDLPMLKKTLQELQRRFPEYRRAYYRHSPDYLGDRRGLAERLSFQCLLVPSVSATLLPNGEVRSCYGRADSVLGNLFEEDMETLWKGERARRARTILESGRSGCFCWEASAMESLEWLPVVRRIRRLSPSLQAGLMRSFAGKSMAAEGERNLRDGGLPAAPRRPGWPRSGPG